jgi:hypothetical protein
MRMQRQILASLSATLFWALFMAGASAQILNPTNIDALCRLHKPETHRSTIVYIDLSSLKQGEDEWGYTILKKLELATRERITVLGVNPSSFEVIEVFDLCYPVFTQSEISQIRDNQSFWNKLFTQDPETQQRDNLQTFDARLRNSLDRLIASSKKFTLGKRRDVLGAIAVDKNRFTERDAVYRIIIFSNGTITDDFDPGASELQIADSLTKKYPTSFSGAEISVFGVTGGDRREALESKERIFSSYFLSNWARIRSFTPSLPQQSNATFAPFKTRAGTFEGGGVKGSVKLSSSAIDGKSTNIWLTFVLGANSLYVPIEGEYSCNGDTCSLKGRVIDQVPLFSSTPYFRKGDLVELTGKNDEKLSGSLTSESKEVFRPDGNAKSEDVKYQMEFVGLK